ncbi:hypothetical protein DSC45_24190 [Streptomyces sp. YIM 130001]|uniref:DoxX family protein n=1 Tax=Streptomyces sp. YIM 130001 TaxID=2259644 RepID=UPI000E6556B1|nr:DoxX family protein [Streptomyces sp. YIM 130001]RII13456.1 hypothetical protein DSC45_24190 [Streptomyces sp. YIM 130001]
MNLTLWIGTGVLAFIALAGGVSKAFLPKEKLSAHEGGRWTRETSPLFIRVLGVLEILAAVGLVLPAVLDVAPVMVPVTAVCWVLLMLGAIVTHGKLGQSKLVALTSVYLLIAVFVAWGRFGPEAFPA